MLNVALRRFWCRDCGRQFNECRSSVLSRTCLPSAGLGASRLQPFMQNLAVIAFVGEQFCRRGQRLDTKLSDLAVADVAARQEQDAGTSLLVVYGVKPDVASAFGAVDTTSQGPSFALPAQRLTLMQLLSISYRVRRIPTPASVLNKPSQRPCCDQRTKRSWSVFGSCTSAQSAQRPPRRSACTIPLSTRRSSTRGLPRMSVGNSGWIRAHRVSENHEKSDLSPPPRRGAESRSGHRRYDIGPPRNSSTSTRVFSA